MVVVAAVVVVVVVVQEVSRTISCYTHTHPYPYTLPIHSPFSSLRHSISTGRFKALYRNIFSIETNTSNTFGGLILQPHNYSTWLLNLLSSLDIVYAGTLARG